MPALICLRKKLWTRTYSTRDQVSTCPVFTRAKVKSRFGILKNLPSHYGEIFPWVYMQEWTSREKIDPWHVKLKVGEIIIIFKIDTAADINVISTKTFRKLRKRPMLKPAHGIYKSPEGTLTGKRKFWVNATHKNKTYRFELHVIDNNTEDLLSRDTAYKMGLVTVVANVNGCIKGDPEKITLRENVVSYCTPTARRIPYSDGGNIIIIIIGFLV